MVDKEKSLPADLPEGTLVRTPLSKAVVYSSVHCGLLNQIGALKSIGGVCDLKYIKLQEVQEGTLVRTPLSKAVVYSSVHCGLLNQIGALKSIGGVCDLKYIKLQEVQDGCRTGSIADVGNGMNPDIEKIIDLHPDAIMLSPFENSGGYGRVEKLNIPIIECADYMETSALGRAEWMRFYGLLFGEAQKADSLFAEVEKNYNELKALVAPLSLETSALGRAEWMRFYGLLFGEAQKADSLFAEVEKNYNELKALVAPLSSAPSVISELKNGSAWYVPGGKSTSARIYADAGANYVFADDEHSGSVPLAFETVFDKGQNADFWLIKYNQAIDKTYADAGANYVFADDEHSGSVPLAFETVFDKGQNADFWLIKYNQAIDKTYKELEQDYAPYTGFRAFKERNIYGCNTGKVDFYEDSPFHPDRLLKDLIKIFHPTLLEGYELKYFTKLAE